MKSVIQRVTGASVEVAGKTVGQIGSGVVVFLSVAPSDTEVTVDRFVDKLLNLGIFATDGEKMSRTLSEVGGSILLVSQFTLHANVKKGKTPSFSGAARPDHARALYEATHDLLRDRGITVQTGQFGAHMQVDLVNDGPVTLLLDVDE